MKQKRHNHSNKRDSYEPDWATDNVWIEIKIRPHAIRSVRDGLLQLSFAMAKKPYLHAFLLLKEPRITTERLIEEWGKIQSTLLPEIIERLNIVVLKGDHFIGISRELDPEECNLLRQACVNETSSNKNLLPLPDFSAEILKILINQWFKMSDPMTSSWLAQIAGCSYRTVAKILESIDESILRHSDRSVELRYFPKDAWVRLLAMLAKSRSTTRYVDRSGQPRSTESLLKRIVNLNRQDVAIGGTLGAKHYYPQLDLTGTPRLDISIHSPDKYVDLDFIEHLDPALKREDDPTVPASLVLHFVRRKDSFFERGNEQILWADRVECLLDLHEMRFESQAQEFLNAWKPDKQAKEFLDVLKPNETIR